MKFAPSPAPVLPQDWPDVLDRVAKALEQTQAEAARTEQALDASFPAEPATDAPWHEAATRLAERLRMLDECVSRAGEAADQVESSLQASETALRSWLAQAEAVRGRLANQATPSV